MCFHVCNNNIIILLICIIHIWLGRDVPLIQRTRTFNIWKFLNVKWSYVFICLFICLYHSVGRICLSLSDSKCIAYYDTATKNFGNRITEVSQHPLNIWVLKHNRGNLPVSSTQTSLRSLVPQHKSPLSFSWSSLATSWAIVTSSSSQMSLSKTRRRSSASTEGSLASLGFSCSGSSFLFCFARAAATLES